MPDLTRRLAALLLAAGMLISGVGNTRAEAEVGRALVLAVDVSLSMEPTSRSYSGKASLRHSGLSNSIWRSATLCWLPQSIHPRGGAWSSAPFTELCLARQASSRHTASAIR